ncbi:MAG: type II toxin-antitoxin system HicA family toxin [Betaproteobacteria bacterium]|nr:type II toxin-antitoxin system HicA family toxin [Betaproteobacteria bacterium]
MEPMKAIFAKPTSATIIFDDIEALLLALGGDIAERAGSRIIVELNGKHLSCHRPHPRKEAKEYQVRDIRDFLTNAGVTP